MLRSGERKAVAKVLWWEQRPDGMDTTENTKLSPDETWATSRDHTMNTSAFSTLAVTHLPHPPRYTSMSGNQTVKRKSLNSPTQGLTSHGEAHTTNSTLKLAKSCSHWNRLLNGYHARVTVESMWPTLCTVAMTSGYSPNQRARIWPNTHEPWASPDGSKY